MDCLLEVRNLKKYFEVPAGYLNAVDDVSFKVRRGQTMGIVGESGCGKSTLGRVILRLHEPTSGRVLLNGVDVTSLDKAQLRIFRKDMQIIFQDPYASLNPRYTVSQSIEEPYNIHNLYPDKKERREKIEELMELVGLSRRMYNSYPHELDGGRRQRVVVARALSISPKFVVCDEPVSALDVSIQAQILNLLMDLQDRLGLTYIFISHDLSVVKHISDEVGVMYLGQLIERCSRKELFRSPKHPYTAALLSAIPSVNVNVKKEKILLKGEITSPINPKPGCRFSARCPRAESKCFEQDPELKDVGGEHFVACCQY